MKSGIYCISNIINLKVYVGSSNNVKYRWRQHRWLLQRGSHNNRHLQGAWSKYGEVMFTYEVLEYCAPEDLKDREQWWVELLQCWSHTGKGYNICHPDRHEVSEETKAKISAAAKGKPKPKGFGEKVSKGLTGKKQSPEHIATLSALRKGRKLSTEHRKKLSTSMINNQYAKGNKLSMEHREKISERQRGKKRPEGLMLRLREINTKIWIVITPRGEEIITGELVQFCRINNLSPTHMRAVARGERTHHKGWMCRKYGEVRNV